MIDGTEILNGPSGLTKNQLMQLVNSTCGGWPVKAFALYEFEASRTQETVYRFADERGECIDADSSQKFNKPFWKLALTSDEYHMRYLTRAAKEKIISQVKEEILGKLQSVVR